MRAEPALPETYSVAPKARPSKASTAKSKVDAQAKIDLDAEIAAIVHEHLTLSVGSSTAVQKIVARLDAMIGEGELAPGERLIESELCAQLEVGRSPLREALRILAGDGVIQLVVNRGARIRRLSRKELSDRSVSVAGVYCNGMELFVKQPAEPFAACLRLLNHLTPKIAGVGRTQDAMTLLSLMTHYHIVVNHFSGNDFLNELVGRVHVQHFERQLAMLMPHELLFSSASKYSEMTKALAMRNSETPIRLAKEIGQRYLGEPRQ